MPSNVVRNPTPGGRKGERGGYRIYPKWRDGWLIYCTIHGFVTDTPHRGETALKAAWADFHRLRPEHRHWYAYAEANFGA